MSLQQLKITTLLHKAAHKGLKVEAANMGRTLSEQIRADVHDKYMAAKQRDEFAELLRKHQPKKPRQ